MKKKQVFSTVLATAVAATTLASSAMAATPVADNDLAYTGEITIMHYSTSEESEGNGGSDGMQTPWSCGRS